jgi:hypothetical protein
VTTGRMESQKVKFRVIGHRKALSLGVKSIFSPLRQ